MTPSTPKRSLLARALPWLKPKDEELSFPPLAEPEASNLDLLQQRYQIAPNYLSQAATWYGQRPWWQKLLMAAGVFSVCLLTSLLCYALALISIPTVILLTSILMASYVLVIIILQNYYDSELKRLELLKSGVKQLETELNLSIDAFNQSDTKLSALSTVLGSEAQQLSQHNQVFEQESTTLNQEIKVFSTATDNLTAVSSTLHSLSERIDESGAAFCNRLEVLHQGIGEDKTTLHQTCQQLNCLMPALVSNTEQLSHFNQKFKQNNAILLANTLLLKNEINSTATEIAAHAEIDAELGQSIANYDSVAASLHLAIKNSNAYLSSDFFLQLTNHEPASPSNDNENETPRLVL